MTSKQLRETLFATGGRVLACGQSYDIKSKRLGAGVCEVWLEPRATETAAEKGKR